jgi:hypothetical protein
MEPRGYIDVPYTKQVVVPGETVFPTPALVGQRGTGANASTRK